MRRILSIIAIVAVVLAGCSGTDTGLDRRGEGGGPVTDRLTDIDPCSLLTDAELLEVLGEVPPAEATEPAGPFTGCSWGTGDVLISIAGSDRVVLAPGEDECPSPGIGEDSYECEQRVKFLANGVHVTVSTIDPFVTDEQLVALARAVLPKLPS